MVTVYNSRPRDKNPPAAVGWRGGWLKEQGPLMSTHLLLEPVKASQPPGKQMRLSPSQVLFALETRRRWSEQQSQSTTCTHVLGADASAPFGPRWARFLLNVSLSKAFGPHLCEWLKWCIIKGWRPLLLGSMLISLMRYYTIFCWPKQNGAYCFWGCDPCQQ